MSFANQTNVRYRTVIAVWPSPVMAFTVELLSLLRRRPSTVRRVPARACQGRKQAAVAHTILIVDDNALVRHLLRGWVELHPGWDVVGEAENGKLAVEQVEQLHPDIVILDLQMPVMNGLDAARRIRILAPKTTLLMFTMHNSAQLVEEAHAAGISEVVSKSDLMSGHLLDALRHACAV